MQRTANRLKAMGDGSPPADSAESGRALYRPFVAPLPAERTKGERSVPLLGVKDSRRTGEDPPAFRSWAVLATEKALPDGSEDEPGRSRPSKQRLDKASAHSTWGTPQSFISHRRYKMIPPDTRPPRQEAAPHSGSSGASWLSRFPIFPHFRRKMGNLSFYCHRRG